MKYQEDRIPNSAELLQKLFAKQGWDEKYTLMQIKENWKEIMGESMSKNILPIKLSNKKLTLECNSSSWRTEIILRKQQIIQSVNNFIRANIIEDIEIR